jgi:hypothetical protein
LSDATREGGDLAHLAGPAAALRQVLAAHFLRDCAHVLEIGGYKTPITGFLTHAPQSVTSIDPKTDPYESDSLGGRPCRVRHIARKFQEVGIDLAPGSYGLVLLGLSLKPYGRRAAVDERLLGLLDGAKVAVVDYALELDRAAGQVPALLDRPGLVRVCSLEMDLEDRFIAGSPYRRRRFVVLEPVSREG